MTRDCIALSDPACLAQRAPALRRPGDGNRLCHRQSHQPTGRAAGLGTHRGIGPSGAEPRYSHGVNCAYPLILASSSPRRQELLRALGVAFQVIPPEIDEPLPAGASVQEAVVALAEAKAASVATLRAGTLVLAADTLVALEGEPLGKPRDSEEARAMLRRLRGRSHRVHTGLCLHSTDSNERRRSMLVSTEVRMRPYTDQEIEATIEAGTPFDKAGAYAIQDPAFAPVDHIEGCYCNVMGLPLWTVRAMLLAASADLRPRRPDGTRPMCGNCPLRTAAGQPAEHGAAH